MSCRSDALVVLLVLSVLAVVVWSTRVGHIMSCQESYRGSFRIIDGNTVVGIVVRNIVQSTLLGRRRASRPIHTKSKPELLVHQHCKLTIIHRTGHGLGLEATRRHT
jgi:hypothetical protein